MLSEVKLFFWKACMIVLNIFDCFITFLNALKFYEIIMPHLMSFSKCYYIRVVMSCGNSTLSAIVAWKNQPKRSNPNA